jgi:hypothetical protein
MHNFQKITSPNNISEIVLHASYMQPGMDLLGGGGAGGCAPPSLALVRGGAGGVLFFMIKQNIIWDKMRYSNLSNNMMISELWTTITIQIQWSIAVQWSKLMGGRHTWPTQLGTTASRAHPPTRSCWTHPWMQRTLLSIEPACACSNWLNADGVTLTKTITLINIAPWPVKRRSGMPRKNLYTCKNAQVVTDLQTSCNMVVVKPISGCVHTACAQLLWQVYVATGCSNKTNTGCS